MQNLTATQISVVIAAILSAFLAFVLFNGRANTADARYGGTGAAMIDGSVVFAATQRTTIINDITAAGGATVSFNTAAMVSVGAIDPSISAATPTGGAWCLEFRSFVTQGITHIQGIIGAAGETNPKKPGDAAIVAAATGRTFAGFVTAGVATGPDFSQALNAFTGAQACNFGTNAFVAMISDNQAIGTTNFLARVPIPGNTSANVMTTALGMGGNNINNAAQVIGTGLSATGAAPGAAGEIDGANVITQTLQVNGNGIATGTLTAADFFHPSDARLKHDWQPIADPFLLLESIHYGRFTWNATGLPDYGIEAQSLIGTPLEALLRMDPNGHYTANYDGLIPVLIAAALSAEHDAVEARAEVKALRRHLGMTVPANGHRPRRVIAAAKQ